MLNNKPLPTFQDVTKRASVALIIFSRMFKNLGDASEKTYQLVETAFEELGNVLSTLARRLRFNAPMAAELLLKRISNELLIGYQEIILPTKIMGLKSSDPNRKGVSEEERYLIFLYAVTLLRPLVIHPN